MHVKIKLFIFFLFVSKTFCEIVEIDDGKIQGTFLKSRLGSKFHAFFKIPYAAPPLENLRFQAPRSVKKWSGILDGTKLGPICFQPRNEPRMSEDCLQLNVFSKNLTDSKPVIVFIHGGGFEFGSSLDQGPHYMIDRDFVVVMMNYRLGVFGFLSLGTKEVPGNAGMKDQVMALKWVRKNIEKFGGNKKQITISGYSAGSISVTAHLASGMSKGLFNRAIAMSGSITTAMPMQSDNLELGQKLGKLLNCVDNLLECLKKTPASEIIREEVKEYPDCEIVIWMPVVEKDFGQARFFTEEPAEVFRKGNFNKVPLIIGRTADEFISPVPDFLAGPSVKEMNKDFNKVAPRCFFYWQNQEKTDAISEALRKAFLPIDPIDTRSFNGLNYLFGDGVIGFPVHKLVHLVTNFTDVFYYKFSYIGHSGFNYPHDKPYGVNHGDDLQYSFFNGRFITEKDPDNFMVKRMTNIFEHFAKTGNPNYDPKIFNWPKHDLSQEFYMDISENMVEKTGLFLERYSVWDKSSASVKNFSNISFEE